MRLSVREERTATKFQVEDGTERSDHVVQDPIEIQMDVVLTGEDARDAFQQMREAFLADRLLVVQTFVTSYDNMRIESFPQESNRDAYRAVAIPLRLVEWRTVQPEYADLPPRRVRDPRDADTVKRGQQNADDTPAERKQSTLYSIFN